MDIEGACTSHITQPSVVIQIKGSLIVLNSVRLVISLIPVLTKINLSRFEKLQASIISYQTRDMNATKLHA